MKFTSSITKTATLAVALATVGLACGAESGYGYDDKENDGYHGKKDYGYGKTDYGYQDKKDYGYQDKKDYGVHDKTDYGYDKKDYGYQDKKDYGYQDKKDYGYHNKKDYGYHDRKNYGYDKKDYGYQGKKDGCLKGGYPRTDGIYSGFQKILAHAPWQQPGDSFFVELPVTYEFYNQDNENPDFLQSFREIGYLGFTEFALCTWATPERMICADDNDSTIAEFTPEVDKHCVVKQMHAVDYDAGDTSPTAFVFQSNVGKVSVERVQVYDGMWPHPEASLEAQESEKAMMEPPVSPETPAAVPV